MNLTIQSDLALLRLSRDVVFSQYVTPICLPGSDFFPDSKGVSYVAGWGSTSETICTTGKYGPDPFTKCAPKFRYHGMTINNCVSMPSPSHNNKLCKELIKFLKPTKLPATGYTQTDIYNKNGKLLRECFSYPDTSSGPHGWCGTCQRDAKFGQSGYCGLGPENKKNTARPKFSNFWGYCQKHCAPFYLRNLPAQNLLQEVQLDILELKDCKTMGATLKVKTEMELCAAKRVSI